MRRFQAISSIVIISLVVAGLVYASRGLWRPWVENLERPTLPTAVSYEPLPTSSSTLSFPTSTKSARSHAVATSTSPKPSSSKPVSVATSSGSEAPSNDPFVVTGDRPTEKNLAVPFLLQAPKQNWDMPYQEACEEASLLMGNAYLQGRSRDFTPDEADRLILELINYETAQGDPPDITIKRLAEVAQAHYGLHPVLKTITSLEPIKNAVANGYVVIVPAYGKALKNPNFHNGGPPYHMLVVKGYLSDGTIITNDPGTRKGKDYTYDPAILLNAIHDWNGGAVEQGEKTVLALTP